MIRLLAFVMIAATALPQESSRRIAPVNTTPGRKALILANTKYKISPLTNPINDATDMALALRSLNFQVSVFTDGTRAQMQKAVTTFTAGLRSGDIAVFYYSGHGLQIDAENYLVPIEFLAQRQDEARERAVPFTPIKAEIEKSAARLSIMILDSCRNNPFATVPDVRGLATLEAALGSYVVFAASPGQTASDNPSARNGLFTTYLLRHLSQPMNIADLFRRVRQDVFAASNNQQLPYLHDQVIANFYLRPGNAEPAKTDVAQSSTSGIESMMQRGRELYATGQCDEALKLFDQVVRRDPQNVYARNAAGVAYMCLDMAKPALEQFSRAIELKPDYSTAYLNRGRLFLTAGQYTLAIDDFDWALEQEPANAMLWWRRGRALFGLRRYEDARTDFTKAIKTEPGNPYGYQGRGQVHHQLGNYRQALEDFSAAINHKRDFAEAYRDRSRTRARLGDEVGAEADLAAAERYSRAGTSH